MCIACLALWFCRTDWIDGVAAWEAPRALPPIGLVVAVVFGAVGGLICLAFALKQYQRLGRIVASGLAAVVVATIAYVVWVESLLRTPRTP